MRRGILLKKRLIFIILVLLAAVLAVPGAMATEIEETQIPEDMIQIYTVEDLMAIAENPSGSYILMDDFDMTGVEWVPMDFAGTLDGNGHAILNLTITQVGQTMEMSYDGNKKSYETAYAGMFCTLRGAVIKDLQLLNVRALVESETPCFLAGIAGYMEYSTISGCIVTGTLELRAFDRIFGVGGIAGYGSGKVENCQVDVTLICTDTDSETKDEQFMGGIFATGYIDVLDSQVTIDGYISEFGSVHSGGITGAFVQYPLGSARTGYITGNSVEGSITFFDKNSPRRAYCNGFVGQTVAKGQKVEKNTQTFKKKEIRKYDTELRPEACETPAYTETVTEATCDTFGYTTYTCEGCSYTYIDHYTLHNHDLTEWTVVVEATELAEGQSAAQCKLCSKEFLQTLEKLEPAPTEPPTEAPTEPPETEPAEEPTTIVTTTEAPEEIPQWLVIVTMTEVIAILIVALLIMLRRNKKRKKSHQTITKKGKFSR